MGKICISFIEACMEFFPRFLPRGRVIDSIALWHDCVGRWVESPKVFLKSVPKGPSRFPSVFLITLKLVDYPLFQVIESLSLGPPKGYG